MSASEAEQVVKLRACAQSALQKAEAGDIEGFIAATESYLTRFEEWQSQPGTSALLSESSNLSADEKAKLREELAGLNAVHQELISRADKEKNRVGSAIGEVHRRATGLKKYIDIYPASVSITGKRQG